MDDKPSSAWAAFFIALVGLFTLAFLALIVLTPRVHAQEAACGPWEPLKAALDKSGQVQTGMGLASDTALVTLFESPDGDEWTMVVLGSSGQACVVGKGQYWSQHPAPLPPVPGTRES